MKYFKTLGLYVGLAFIFMALVPDLGSPERYFLYGGLGVFCSGVTSLFEKEKPDGS